MSIYDREKVYLPQVKVSLRSRDRLYRYLGLFSRSYADFVRDVCDANITWHASENVSFNDQLRRSLDEVAQSYRLCAIPAFFKNSAPNKPPIYEQLKMHQEPIKQLVRLPQVSVSKWQAANLEAFLSKFSRSYADFIRLSCELVYVDTIDAQAGAVQFRQNGRSVFLRILDEILNTNALRPPVIKRQWPLKAWRNRFSKNRSQDGQTTHV